MATAHLLSLSTLDALPSVQIDGRKYPLKTPEALSLIGMRAFRRLAPRLAELFEKEPLSADEQGELEDTLRGLCELVLEAPAGVHARLSDVQRLQVYQAFLKLSPSAAAPTSGSRNGRGAPPKTGTRSTGVPSSRGSRGSTASNRAPSSRRSPLPS